MDAETAQIPIRGRVLAALTIFAVVAPLAGVVTKPEVQAPGWLEVGSIVIAAATGLVILVALLGQKSGVMQ